MHIPSHIQHLRKRKKTYHKESSRVKTLDKVISVISFIFPLTALPQIYNIWILKIVEGVSFLTTKLNNLNHYIAFGVSDDIKPMGVYSNMMEKKGIELSKSDFLTQALIADLGSLHTWSSFASIKNFINDASASTEVPTLKFGSLEITAPLISHYLTNNGAFYNLTFVINPHDESNLELILGRDADFIAGQVNSSRGGLKLNNVHFGRAKISPFVFLTSYGGQKKGFSYGAELAVPILENVDFKLLFENNEADILENKIKGKSEGWSTTFGMTYKF